MRAGIIGIAVDQRKAIQGALSLSILSASEMMSMSEITLWIAKAQSPIAIIINLRLPAIVLREICFDIIYLQMFC